MSSSKPRSSWVTIFSSLGWPLVVGISACSLFYAGVYRGPLDNELVRRYVAVHPVSFVTTGMFFVGMAALLLRMGTVLMEFWWLRRLQLSPIPIAGQSIGECATLNAELESLPAGARNSYLGQRLGNALVHVERTGSSEDLGDELKYLSDMDRERQHNAYALVRIIIWAIPMLGFLGTVIGITQALGDLATQQLGGDLQQAMKGLLSGLYVAFDTTALALSLAIVLMFVQFLIDRIESQLLTVVDHRSTEQLVGRFYQLGASKDPVLGSVQRMGELLVQNMDQLVQRQAELWQKSMADAEHRWTHLTANTGAQLETALQKSLVESLQQHAQSLAAIERDAMDKAQHRWEQWQTVLSDNARMLKGQQMEMVRHGEVLERTLQATAEVVKLETALNDNLKLLAGSRNFEDTVMSLSAAIHLLTTRLDTRSSLQPGVVLDGKDDSPAQGHAA
ncbi:MAG: MotA/TolQ/ExbB proton channel family protein [Pirellulaceae bacterium]